MKMRTLVTMLCEIEAAKAAIVEAHNSLSHGGNEQTMCRKEAWLADCENQLEYLLDQEIDED